MAYKATIASAGGDDSTMAKSFVMACEGSVANWYSYLPPQSINNWYQLKGRLLQDFQGFRRLNTNTVKDFKCPQHDREPLYDYFRRFVQKKAQIPNFLEKDAIEILKRPLKREDLNVIQHQSQESNNTFFYIRWYITVQLYAVMGSEAPLS